MLLNIILVIFGLLGLYFGGQWLVKGAARLASSFGVSALAIGLTIVAWATSAPEMVVNLNAATQGSSDMALGNVLGSNIVNIGLTLGLIGIFFTVRVGWQLTRREIPIMIAVSLLTYFLASDGVLDRTDGIILLIGFLSFSALIYWLVRQEQRKVAASLESYEKHEKLIDTDINRLFEVGRLVVGITVLIIGANWTVDGATAIARSVGISEFIIGLTLVAVGTSLPELASSIVAAKQGQTDIAVGNIVGSNIANLSLILGATATTTPINVAPNMLALEIPVMIGFTLLMLVFSLDRVVSRWEAVAMLAGYAGFIVFSFVR